MPLEAQSGTVSLSPPLAVDVDKIEKELAAMWSGASGSGEGTTEAGVTRACTLNLVVATTPVDDRELLEDVLDDISERHPGRTLILVADREGTAPRIEAYISMRCRLLGATGNQICGEQVTIDAGGPLVETAATAVAPLLVPDVPVYLWWKDIPAYDDPLFLRLAQMSDRIVLDSAAFDQPCADLLRLARHTSGPSHPMRISDLNWGRLTPWRTLLASFWDVPDYRPLLAAIDRVTLTYRAPDIAPQEIAPQALLLAGWLASRLGWEVVGGRVCGANEIAETTLRTPDRALGLSFRRESSDVRHGGTISSLVLSATDCAAEFSVALRSDGARLQTEARIGALHSIGRLLANEAQSDADGLCQELEFRISDAIYEDALARAAQLIG